MQAPLKQSPLYPVLHGLGATFGPHLGWNVAVSIDSPEAEAAASKQGVGIADASWLGKVELKGRQAELECLTFDEGKTWSLARGHYLVLCDPANCDVVCKSVERQTERLADSYSGSTDPNVRPEPVEGPSVHGSTGSPRTDKSGVSAESVSAASRGQEPPMRYGCVHAIDVTSTYAGILLAGPHSRDVLQRLTAPDVSNAALANGACLSAKVAGLHARIVRDDLDETLAYWLFVGTEYAVYAWEAIMHAGQQFGIVPIGQEAAQRMRSAER